MKVICTQNIVIKDLDESGNNMAFFQDQEYNLPAKIANEHPAFFKKLSATKVEETK